MEPDPITTVGGGPSGAPVPDHHPQCPCPDCEIDRRNDRLNTAWAIARAEWATNGEETAA